MDSSTLLLHGDYDCRSGNVILQPEPEHTTSVAADSTSSGGDTPITADDPPPPSQSTATTDRDSSKITFGDKKRIMNYNPPWPVCEYSLRSKRFKKQHVLHTFTSDLDVLNGWSDLASISIDGMNGTGKSTLAKSMNRLYMKINTHCPDITSGSSYNCSPLRSLEYMMFHVLCNTGNTFVVWDRSRYSNLIFAYIHNIMSVYRGRRMPGPDDDEPFLYINNMALATGLFMTVSYVEHMCADKHPILFVVNSDLRTVARSLLDRGGTNDVYNAKEYNYQMAQYHVYRYFARLLSAPLIDLDVLFKHYDMTWDEIHEKVKGHVDVQERVTGATPGLLPREEAISLHDFCDRHRDSMVYDYSTK